ncbi:MAG: GtrA family protein, partial [Sphingobium sp.]|nr:GtrA family protein [Sphingobium sp.]
MIDRLRALALLVARPTFVRYLLASICALASDMALFLALDRWGAPPLFAA